MQLLPAAPGLDRHITIFQIDLDNGIHAGHIDQHAIGARWRCNRWYSSYRPREGRSACRAPGRPYREDILKVQRYLLGIRRDDLGRQ